MYTKYLYHGAIILTIISIVSYNNTIDYKGSALNNVATSYDPNDVVLYVYLMIKQLLASTPIDSHTLACHDLNFQKNSRYL
jgi:hypothetical protein